jgi:hypothetical protein
MFTRDSFSYHELNKHICLSDVRLSVGWLHVRSYTIDFAGIQYCKSAWNLVQKILISIHIFLRAPTIRKAQLEFDEFYQKLLAFHKLLQNTQ